MRTMFDLAELISGEISDRAEAIEAIHEALPANPKYRVCSKHKKVMERYKRAGDDEKRIPKEHRDFDPADNDSKVSAVKEGFSFKCYVGPPLKEVSQGLREEVETYNNALRAKREELSYLERSKLRLERALEPIQRFIEKDEPEKK